MEQILYRKVFQKNSKDADCEQGREKESRGKCLTKVKYNSYSFAFFKFSNEIENKDNLIVYLQIG